MHTQQYKCAGSDRKSTLPFFGVRLGFLDMFRVLYFFFFKFYLLLKILLIFVVVQKSRFGSTRRPQNAEANLSSKEESTRSHPYRPNAPGLGPRALLFFLLNRNISRWREREREGRNTHAAGVVWDLSRWRKKTPLLDGRVCERVLSNSLPSL